jgi:hypothetical protein
VKLRNESGDIVMSYNKIENVLVLQGGGSFISSIDESSNGPTKA